MPRQRRLPPDDVLWDLRKEGWTYKRIAIEYGSTVGGVYFRLRKIDAVQDTPRHTGLIPWRVKKEHEDGYPVKAFRLLGQHLRGERLAAGDLRRITRWVKKNIKDADMVLSYRPDVPPNPASAVGGFHFTPRADSEDTLTRVEPGVATRPGAERDAPTRKAVFAALGI